MILGVIPARYASSRFPGKPLADIKGKSMIRRVYEKAQQAKDLTKIVVATDDERIMNHVQGFGGTAIMTASHHQSGTDRCLEALDNLGEDFHFVVNIQGDEPFISPEQIDELTGALSNENIEIVTQISRIHDSKILSDPGEAKVVLNEDNEAIYFSRSPIPFFKGAAPELWPVLHPYYRHVGLYAYRHDILRAIAKRPMTLTEQAESLEQLRWLGYGYKIKCVPTEHFSICIDTPEDLENVLRNPAINF